MKPSLPVVGSLRFHCTSCGSCCRKPGYVFLTREELDAMAAFLGLTPESMTALYDIRPDDEAEGHVIEVDEGYACRLLDEAGRCRVHPVKPAQCRTFPFWDELLDDRRAWRAAKRTCEGIDHPGGREYTAEEIERLRRGLGST